MSDMRFTTDHEYIRIDGENGIIGVTNFAQEQLGDIVFVELPEVGKRIAKGEQLATVESVKAASEVFSPVSGEVVEANAALEENPATVNEDPLGAGWFVKLRLTNEGELSGLMDEAAYEAHLRSL
ncbi:glycine cleavage system protein GcvH [Methylocystis heyeri]|uniref:Glycine cleavage system H protein n=1 Tax=Methylocystis heyeri TaxID=391905 RepID=A0A6B8KBN8_9HYPH|nr:glycine cleavage system protein GcvH [Methylocystis heyeri]QGM45139.1 glycine cleavage system protein GcvH [Methylocystis heyeri]